MRVGAADAVRNHGLVPDLEAVPVVLYTRFMQLCRELDQPHRFTLHKLCHFKSHIWLYGRFQAMRLLYPKAELGPFIELMYREVVEKKGEKLDPFCML